MTSLGIFGWLWATAKSSGAWLILYFMFFLIHYNNWVTSNPHMYVCFSGTSLEHFFIILTLFNDILAN